MLLFGFSFGCYLCVECLLESFYVNVDMPSVLLELFIALDCDECEGEFYEEVEPCDYETEGKLQIDHALTYIFILCITL